MYMRLLGYKKFIFACSIWDLTSEWTVAIHKISKKFLNMYICTSTQVSFFQTTSYIYIQVSKVQGHSWLFCIEGILMQYCSPDWQQNNRDVSCLACEQAHLKVTSMSGDATRLIKGASKKVSLYWSLKFFHFQLRNCNAVIE